MDTARKSYKIGTVDRFHYIWPVLFFLACAVLLALPKGSFAESHNQIRISGVIYLGDLPTVVAERQSFFGRHELNVVVEYKHSGKRNLERLRAGETDFALMALTPLVLDRLADHSPDGLEDPVILASLVHSISLNQVVALTDSGIEIPSDFLGRRIALLKGTNAEFVWWLFAHFHGFDPADVDLRNRPLEEIPDALVNGDIDGAVIWEPWTSRLEQRLGKKLRQFPGSHIYTAKWVIVTTRRIATEQAAKCRAVLFAYREAIEFIERHPQQAIRLYAELADITPAILGHDEQTLDYDLSLDWSLIATLQQRFDWARQAGYPTAAGEIHVLSLIEPAPLRSIFPSAVGIPALTMTGKPAS